MTSLEFLVGLVLGWWLGTVVGERTYRACWGRIDRVRYKRLKLRWQRWWRRNMVERVDVFLDYTVYDAHGSQAAVWGALGYGNQLRKEREHQLQPKGFWERLQWKLDGKCVGMNLVFNKDRNIYISGIHFPWFVQLDLRSYKEVKGE